MLLGPRCTFLERLLPCFAVQGSPRARSLCERAGKFSLTRLFVNRKPSTPFGQLPMLEDGDVTVAQSMAIFRYAARKFGLEGETLVAWKVEQERGFGGLHSRQDEEKESQHPLMTLFVFVFFATVATNQNNKAGGQGGK